MKITITECDSGVTRKKQDGTEFTVYTCKDSTGKSYQSFEAVPVGDGDYTVTPASNPAYADRIKAVKAFGAGKFGPSYNQYRICAMNNVVSLYQAGKVEKEKIQPTYQWFLKMLEEGK